MSIIASLGILILAMLIMASLQLTPGVFALFYHYALGKFSKRKASDLSIFFIVGVELINVLIFLSVYFILSFFMLDDLSFRNDVFAYVLVGIFSILAVFCFFYYFRRGNGTKLFISRRYAKGLDRVANSTKSRADAVLLGTLAGSYELFLTLPLYMVVSVIALEFNTTYLPANIVAILFIISPLVPLFILRWQYQYGHNLADILRRRTKNKLFIRSLLALSFILIAILIIYFKVI